MVYYKLINFSGDAPLNLRQLEAFRATMRSGSITEAAEMMHISQPSVSRLIADIERSVGFPLFLRSGRGCNPTKHRTLQRHYLLMLCLKLGRKKVPYVAAKSPMATYLCINYASGYR